MIAALSLTFKFADLRMSDIEEAANMKWRDFEDAVQSATASRIGADYIITRADGSEARLHGEHVFLRRGELFVEGHAEVGAEGIVHERRVLHRLWQVMRR